MNTYKYSTVFNLDSAKRTINAFLLLNLLAHIASGQSSANSKDTSYNVKQEESKLTVADIELHTVRVPPTWAMWQRQVLDMQYSAAKEFVDKYTRADGSLIWRKEWPGFDGSDDGYESFYNFPLCYVLGGHDDFDRLSRHLWEGVTKQFTEYGQVHNEFDAHYDWMHHGESYVNFYFFGLCDPDNSIFSQRSQKFAGMYTGHSSEAANYDAQLKIIRSPINGSRGPHFESTAEDWVTHRPILANYPLPYDDIPHVRGSSDWNDDDRFPFILKAINDRMMKGDVPLNLQSTSLIADAYMYTGDERYKQWIEEYVQAWIDRVAENNGILPDNVGLSGKIGENMDGKWWGGYYGWRWPHGLFNQLESTVIGATNAYLVSGDPKYLELPRSVLNLVDQNGKMENGQWVVPHRHGEQGWFDFRSMNPNYPVHLWFVSRDSSDWKRIIKSSNPATWSSIAYSKGKGDSENSLAWLSFLEGQNPDYPETVLKANYQETLNRLHATRSDQTTVDEQDVHHWQKRNPVILEGLVQMMLGAPNHIYHGGLLHASLRYFDPQRERPGVPDDVAVCVRRISSNSVTLELVNLNPGESCDVIIQAGMFGEHQFTRIRQVVVYPYQFHTINDPRIRVHLGPGAVGEIVLDLDRYVNRPSYSTPWKEAGQR